MLHLAPWRARRSLPRSAPAFRDIPEWLQKWVSITIFLGTIIALYWGLVCSYGFREDRSKEARGRYMSSLRTLCCLLLLSAVNVAKTMLAKLMSAHFYVEGYFDKMQDALRKVCRLPGHGQPL